VHSRLAEWCRDRGVADLAVVPIWVARDSDQLICYVASALPARR